MQFCFLGETMVLAAGQALAVGAPRQQAVLAALIADPGRPVAIETLIDRVWGADPPPEARNVLYSHLSRIRHLLKQAADASGSPSLSVERRYAGYVVPIDPGCVDLHQFRQLVERCADPMLADTDRAELLAEALGLWRGTPLAGIPGEWAAQVRDSWQRIRLDAVIQRARVELRLGHPEVVLATLPDAIAEHPYVEPLEELLMRALHAAGRDAEALNRFAALRQRLAEGLGTDPSAELRTLHEDLLRGTLPPLPKPAKPAQPSQPSQPSQPAANGAPPHVRPAQLPPDMYGFTGREAELHQLDRMLADWQRSTAVVISAVSGTAGVGKSALALHWAHRVRDEFADGQLYVNLRGFDPTGTAMTPAEAVRGFLDAFEVPPERMPPGLDAQIGLYRSLLADRRVLVLLDNARDSEHVRPLLPGVPGCLAIVTSRNQLSGLVSTTGALPLSLDLLTIAESRELLARRLGPDRVAAEPQAVDAIIASCARLPIALAVVASRAATHPSFPLAALASELRDARGRLDELADSDPATDVRAVFSWSYRQLNPEAGRLFRLLGLHPGPDTSAAAAASLAGVPAGTGRRLLIELTRAQLVNEYSPGRYTFHDLLRAYASELVEADESPASRHTALHRMLDHYLHTADAAARLMDSQLDPITLVPSAGEVTVESLNGHTQALAWFTTEHQILTASVQQAHAAGFDTHASQLAWVLSNFLDRKGHWQDWADTQRTALQAAQRQANRVRQATAHRGLGRALLRLGRLDEAHLHLTQALGLYSKLDDDDVGQAHTHRYVGLVRELQGRYADALHHGHQALDLYRLTHHVAGQATALNDIGWHRIQLGDYAQALVHCTEALDLQQELGDRNGQAHTLDSLGHAHHGLGHYEQAVTCYERSVQLYEDLSDYYELARTLTGLGDTHRAAGDLLAARQAWQRAEALLSELAHPDLEQIRAKLHDLGDDLGAGAGHA